MEYEKLINLLDNKPNQPNNIWKKNWVEIKDESWGTYNKGNYTKFKTRLLKSSLCGYGVAYILVKGTITVANIAAAEATVNDANKKVIFKNCAPFTSCISRANNTQIDDAQYIDVVIPMYILTEYCDKYLSKSIWNFMEMYRL